MSAHTPGPWQYGEGNDFYIERVGTAADDSATLAIVYTEADARLIAAAPELLEALECMTEAVDGYLHDPFKAEVAAARAAIALARGDK